MKKFKLITLIGILFTSIFMFFSITGAKAADEIASKAEINLDAEINESKTVLRFIVTTSGVELKEIDEIELILKKDGVPSKKQLFINTVYTSISNASREYNEALDTYYGVINITDTKLLSGSTIEANTKITYTDSSVKTLDNDKIINLPDIPTYVREGDTIYFGRYPQTEEKSDEITAKLNSMVGTPENPLNDSEWLDYGYYISNVKTEYMYYIDIDLNNDSQYDYRGVYFNQYRPNAVDKASVDVYSNQDMNGYFINNVYWFKYEPIKWDVLNIEDGKAFISSNLSLDSQQVLCAYGAPGDTKNSHNGYDDRHLAAYDASDIRIWLNDTFYNDAFDSSDKKIITKTLVDNGYDTIGDPLRTELDESSIDRDALLGTNTKDYVFLLSYDEVKTYYPGTSVKRVNPTDYSRCQGVYVHTEYNSINFWNRTPATTLYQTCYTSSVGSQYDNYNGVFRTAVTFTDRGVKPALVIDIESFMLNVTSNDLEYGSANLIGESSHSNGEEITLEALPTEGYSFEGWYANNELLSSENPYTFYMPNKNYDIEARFTTYTITTSVDDAEAVSEMTTFDHQNYTAGETVNLSITLNDGYSFLGWYIGEELVNEKESFSYTMPHENVELIARTTRYTLNVESHLANGFENAYKITFDSNGGNKIYSQYSNNIIYPIPTKEGYIFVGWYDNPEFNGDAFDFKSEINSDITLYAKWIENDSTYKNIGYTEANNVTIPSNGSNYSDYYRIVTFVDGNINLYTFWPYVSDYATVELYNSNMELIDSYVPEDKGWDYDIKSYTCNAGDVLYIRFKPSKLWYGYDKMELRVYFTQDLPNKGYDFASTTLYDNVYTKAGSKVTLTASNKNDTTFLGWYDSNNELLSSNENYTFTMPNSNVDIYAKYEYYTLTLVNDDENAGTISDYNNTRVVAGTNKTIKATPNDGYAFLGWYDLDDNLITDSVKYIVDMPYENVTYVAKFKAVSIVLNKSIEAAGEVSVSKDLEYGKEATLTATVNYGYIFIGWYNADEEELTKELTYTFNVGDSNVYEAKYIVSKISISASLEEAGSISKFDFGYLDGQELELTYTINPNYTWYGWYLNGELLSADKTITIITNSDEKAYVARTEKYVVNITANIEEAMNDYATITYDTNGGSEVASQKSYEVTYIIPTKTGNIFVGWYDNALCEGEAYDFNSQIEEDITLYAKWIPTDYAVFPFNVSRYTRIPKGNYEEEEAWYAFYPLTTGEAHLTSNKISSYGYIVRIYAADKTTLIGTDSNNKDNVYIDFRFNVEANNVYYMVLEKAYINAGSYNNIKLEVELPSVTCITARNGDIVYAGETVYIYADAKEGYTFVGWYSNNELITANKYYSFVMPESSVSYEARYTQNQVTYTVNHYLQNVDDNEYTIVTEDIEIVNGLTGEDTEAEANSYAGFNAKAFEQVKINGDNSTVVNIYYDRIIYNLTTTVVNTINETTPGSVNIKNGSYRYNKSITLIATPNTGYQFVGWYNGNDLVLSDAEYTFNMPSNDLNLVAKFESLEVDYTVEYWLENANDNDYTYDKSVTLSGYSGEQTEAVATPYSDFVTPSVTQTTINGDGSTTVVIQYKRKTIDKVALEIYFGLYNDNKYGSVVTPDGFITYSTGYYYDPHRHYSYKENVKVGVSFTLAVNPNDGYMLEGWYLNDVRFEGSESNTLVYTVSLDDVTDGNIWLVAKMKARYKIQYNYQNNINEWVADNSIQITYDADTPIDGGYINLNDTTDLSSDIFTDIKDGYEFKEFTNVTVDEKDRVVMVYCTPKQYFFNVTRNYGINSHLSFDFDWNGIYLYYGQIIPDVEVVLDEGFNCPNVAFDCWFIVSNNQRTFVTHEKSVTGLIMGNADAELFACFICNYQQVVYLEDENGEYQYSDTYSCIRTGDVGSEVSIPSIVGYTWESIQYFDEEHNQIYMELPEYYSTDASKMPSVEFKFKRVS